MSNRIQLKPIDLSKPVNVLFLGNGLNRCFDQNSWKKKKKNYSTIHYTDEQVKILEALPYPLQAVVYSNDQVDSVVAEIVKTMMPKDNIPDQNGMIQNLLDKPFEIILTTNYSYEIEKAVDSEFHCEVGLRNKYRCLTEKGSSRDQQFGLYRLNRLSMDKRCYDIWHIHGEASIKNSIVLGHYYYGNLLRTIEEYCAKSIAYYKICKSKDLQFRPKSWIDYFLVGNVYMVGYGFDPSEMDLWWLVNCKKRHFSDVGTITMYERTEWLGYDIFPTHP